MSTFKNFTSDSIGTTAADVYTVPANATAVIIGLNLANRESSRVLVSAQLGSTYIVRNAPIPPGSALSVLAGKIVGEAADTVTVTSDTASSVDAILSVLEQP